MAIRQVRGFAHKWAETVHSTDVYWAEAANPDEAARRAGRLLPAKGSQKPCAPWEGWEPGRDALKLVTGSVLFLFPH